MSKKEVKDTARIESVVSPELMRSDLDAQRERIRHWLSLRLKGTSGAKPMAVDIALESGYQSSCDAPWATAIFEDGECVIWVQLSHNTSPIELDDLRLEHQIDLMEGLQD